MGARQSYLYIYLKNKDKDCNEAGCSVSPSKSVVKGCIDFELVTYTIQYKGDSTYYDIYIYDTEDKDPDAYYIFGYCSPRTHQVANKVEVYYSVLAPDKPLVISFVTNSQKYNCIYDDLKYARWNWASYITEHTFKGDVLLKLKEQYRKLNLNKTIKLAVGEEATKDVTVFQQEIGQEKKNYRIIYKPNGKESVLNSNCIFNHETIDPSKQLEVENGCKEHKANDKKNQIDPYCLTSVKDHFFDGIIFIDLRKKDICLKRMDQEGCWWAEEKIEYNDNKDLESQLSTIKSGLKSGNTVLLDAKATYTGVEVTPDTSKQVYIIYKHVKSLISCSQEQQYQSLQKA
nr:hypothetical protein MACL_00003068 [Theileria orientalis]